MLTKMRKDHAYGSKGGESVVLMVVVRVALMAAQWVLKKVVQMENRLAG